MQQLSATWAKQICYPFLGRDPPVYKRCSKAYRQLLCNIIVWRFFIFVLLQFNTVIVLWAFTHMILIHLQWTYAQQLLNIVFSTSTFRKSFFTFWPTVHIEMALLTSENWAFWKRTPKWIHLKTPYSLCPFSHFSLHIRKNFYVFVVIWHIHVIHSTPNNEDGGLIDRLCCTFFFMLIIWVDIFIVSKIYTHQALYWEHCGLRCYSGYCNWA